MTSGGSPVSTSATWAAMTVTVQVVVAGRSTVGSRVIWFVPLPLTVNA